MKRKILLTVSILMFSMSVFAVNSTIDIKGGVQIPDAPDKAGFDSAITLNIGLDKYFTLGVESGFGWVKWKDENANLAAGNIVLTKVEKTNAYTLPLLAVATVRLADMMDSYGFMPYVTGGAGYSWTWYRHPEFKDNFHGFTWEVMGGLKLKLGTDSNLSFIAEGGYRNAAVENSENYELDMSGFIGRAGISFPLEASY